MYILLGVTAETLRVNIEGGIAKFCTDRWPVNGVQLCCWQYSHKRTFFKWSAIL